MAELVEHLPDKQEATNSNPSRTISDSIFVVQKQTLNLALAVLYTSMYGLRLQLIGYSQRTVCLLLIGLRFANK